ncbi:hypothetical protein EJB05_12928, partial [Eragrostis curvula]
MVAVAVLLRPPVPPPQSIQNGVGGSSSAPVRSAYEMPARPRSMAAADLAAHLLSAAAAIDFARHHGRRLPPPASHPPCRSYVHRLMPSPTIHVPSPLWPSALAPLVFHGYTATGCPAIFSHVYPPASLGNNIFPGIHESPQPIVYSWRDMYVYQYYMHIQFTAGGVEASLGLAVPFILPVLFNSLILCSWKKALANK